MSCLPIVSDRAATEGSKYFKLGRQPHKFLTRNTCFLILGLVSNIKSVVYSVVSPRMTENDCKSRFACD